MLLMSNKLPHLRISLKSHTTPLIKLTKDLLLIMLNLKLSMLTLLIKKNSEILLNMIEIQHKLILMKKLLDGMPLLKLMKHIWLNYKRN